MPENSVWGPEGFLGVQTPWSTQVRGASEWNEGASLLRLNKTGAVGGGLAKLGAAGHAGCCLEV